jgi:hypothetical protein
MTDSNYHYTGNDLDTYFQKDLTVSNDANGNLAVAYHTTSIDEKYKVGNSTSYTRYLEFDTTLSTSNYGTGIKAADVNFQITDSDLANNYVKKNSMHFVVLYVSTDHVALEIQGWVKHGTTLYTYTESGGQFLQTASGNNHGSIIMAAARNGNAGTGNSAVTGGGGGAVGTTGTSITGGIYYAGGSGSNGGRESGASPEATGGGGGSNAGGAAGFPGSSANNKDNGEAHTYLKHGHSAGIAYSGGGGGLGRNDDGSTTTAVAGGAGGAGWYGGGGGGGGGFPGGGNDDSAGAGGGAGSSFHITGTGDGHSSYSFYDMKLTTNGKSPGISTALGTADRPTNVYSIKVFSGNGSGTEYAVSRASPNVGEMTFTVGTSTAWA